MRRTGVLAFGIGVLAIAARADAADVLVLGDGWHDAEISAALTTWSDVSSLLKHSSSFAR